MGEDELVIYIPLDRDFILPPDVADVIRAHAGLIRFERIGREVSVPTVAELDTHL